MSTRAKLLRAAAPAALCACVLVAPALPAAVQEEGTTRKLWDTAFGVTAKRKSAARRRTAGRGYRVVTPEVPTDEVAADTPIGVTVWRLRPPATRDAGERLLIQDGTAGWLPERVAAGAGLAEGDRVRLGVEAARSGYLYVIDREQYSDGTTGDPYLIFPTTRTLGGRNEVRAGRIVEIPARDDGPPYFTLRRSSPRQVGEVLSVVVTPAPIEGLHIGDGAQRLAPERVAAWEKEWGAGVGRMEMEGGAGLPWTKDERDAGADGDAVRALPAEAPGPQTLFYRPRSTPGAPLLVNVQLKYRGASVPARRRAAGR